MMQLWPQKKATQEMVKSEDIDYKYGEGFCIGNIMKYAQRYGKKNGYNRSDLLKVVHYGIMALHNHDRSENETK